MSAVSRVADWLRNNSSGSYRVCSEAADLLEEQRTRITELEGERNQLRAKVTKLRQDISDTLDGVIKIAKERDQANAQVAAGKALAEVLAETQTTTLREDGEPTGLVISITAADKIKSTLAAYNKANTGERV